MKKYIEHFLLFLPLSWYAHIYCDLIFNIKYPLSFIPVLAFPCGTFCDDDAGIFAGIWMIAVIASTLFVALCYTAYNKLWWWFGAYMILGGLPIGVVWILTIIG